MLLAPVHGEPPQRVACGPIMATIEQVLATDLSTLHGTQRWCDLGLSLRMSPEIDTTNLPQWHCYWTGATAGGRELGITAPKDADLLAALVTPSDRAAQLRITGLEASDRSLELHGRLEITGQILIERELSLTLGTSGQLILDAMELSVTMEDNGAGGGILTVIGPATSPLDPRFTLFSASGAPLLTKDQNLRTEGDRIIRIWHHSALNDQTFSLRGSVAVDLGTAVIPLHVPVQLP